jgi:hypothetical protein
MGGMPMVFLSEDEAPAIGPVERPVNLPRVPVAGEFIELVADGEQVTLEVTRVVFKEGDGETFTPVVTIRRQPPSTGHFL